MDVIDRLIEGLDPARPVLIAGPTGAGKSALALAIAEAQGGVIVNADALQVYREWRVLTARPGPEETARAPHLLYGHVGVETPYSVGDWLREVSRYLISGPRPILVGGTGLYFTALTEGLTEIPPIPAAIRAQGDALRRDAPARMLAELDAEDPETAHSIDRQNPMRVQRAWEVLRATGRGFKAWHRATPPPLLPREAARAVVIHAPRAWLTPRLERRFDQMLDDGALDEVAALLPRWQPDAPGFRAIGAAELAMHLRGELPLEDAREKAIQQTVQYAKRQRTWFRNRFKAWEVLELSTAG